MPVDWPYGDDYIQLGGVSKQQISRDDALRQTETAKNILADLRDRPGVLLADEVGMGKTYVAMAVIASAVSATRTQHRPIVVMVPRGLRHKWQRDWDQFKIHCVRNGALKWVRDEYAHTPTEFFKLRDDPPSERAHVIFITTGCFSRGLHDPYVKLAMLRLARRHTKLTARKKRMLCRWAATLVRLQSNHWLTPEIVERLMQRDVLDWKQPLVWAGVLREDADDPVPAMLRKAADKIDWTPLCEAIRHHLPGRQPGCVSHAQSKKTREVFNKAWRDVYGQWLQAAQWRSPLLVLDEAHHAKNDTTRLAQLFRPETDEDVALLNDKFDRMLFLTATPFQLGHQELIRVLRSFAAVRWSYSPAPRGTADVFHQQMKLLENALDENRRAGRYLDQLWGKLRRDMIAITDENSNTEGQADGARTTSTDKNNKALADENEIISNWWALLTRNPKDAWENRLIRAVAKCQATREHAEQLLRPWLIRHNRSPYLPADNREESVKRREVHFGRAIRPEPDRCGLGLAAIGLPLDADAALPFLLTARAQGQLAHSGGARAYFAEGLASSYEAFHDTRAARKEASERDDGYEPSEDHKTEETVPTSWYESQIARLIPSRKDTSRARLQHPKINATVARVLDLWGRGEKVLVFCFYRQTAKALLEHLRDGVQSRIVEIAGGKFGLDPEREANQIQDWLARIARRLTNEQSPFYQEVRQLVASPLEDPEYHDLRKYRSQLANVLMAYFRSPAFIARYLPLDEPEVRTALEEGQSRPEVIKRGVEALRRAVEDEKDASDQTCLGRVRQFLEFAMEFAERARRHVELREGEEDDEYEDPLRSYLEAVSVYSRPRRPEDIDRDGLPDEGNEDGSYRVMPLVRMVYGETKYETRDRLMQAFNSPLFPEILVSSSVLGEGVDLHRFCRHVIHHDLCWNPSSLEQRTGRLDRILCKAEVCRKSIQVYQPFLAGSADEKMFRVVRDRERWFQVVMGQKFEFDEAASESIADRVPLPNELAEELTFDLRRWRCVVAETVSPQVVGGRNLGARGLRGE